MLTSSCEKLLFLALSYSVVKHCQVPDISASSNVRLTGDYVQRIADPVSELATKFLSRLRAKHGVFAVLGNHDYKVNRSKETGWGKLHLFFCLGATSPRDN
jgi:predicted MPP superfamily phosphohydrolase